MPSVVVEYYSYFLNQLIFLNNNNYIYIQQLYICVYIYTCLYMYFPLFLLHTASLNWDPALLCMVEQLLIQINQGPVSYWTVIHPPISTNLLFL